MLVKKRSICTKDIIPVTIKIYAIIYNDDGYFSKKRSAV